MRCMRKLRRLFSVAIPKWRWIFFKSLKDAFTLLKEEWKKRTNDLIKKYQEHCALFIQKVWRGHQAWIKILPQVKFWSRIFDKIKGFVRGWKVRKIMKCWEIISLCKVNLA